MGFLETLSREYLRYRHYGGHHHRRTGWGTPGRYWGSPRPSGYWMGRGHRRGPFGAYRPRRRVEVRGCGCCLPIPLALALSGAYGMRAAMRSRSR